jgi:hypothetical protein
MMDLREIDWLRRGQVSVQWIQLAQDRGQWRALVNEVMSLRVLAPQSVSLLVTSVIGCTFCFLPAFMHLAVAKYFQLYGCLQFIIPEVFRKSAIHQLTMFSI